uniref:Small ribosomal subunit protein uS8c n=1 Tax=Solanum tuberosum TaxID=4113 RepID=M1C411_SOLTU
MFLSIVGFLPDLGFMRGNASANATTTIDYHHPLYIYPSDAPSSLSIGIMLTGSDNYTLVQTHQSRCYHEGSYIGEFEYVDDHRSGKIVVELNGRLNKCGVISPCFDVGVKEIEGWTARLLPSRQFGYIVLTTSAGIMDHEEARRKNVGGKVLGFFY